jgi:hypothetical protein
LKANVPALTYTPTLDKHLSNLEKWGFIADVKPQGNGRARKITLIYNYDKTIKHLKLLESALTMVNLHFD